jgi:hypothetical protein
MKLETRLRDQEEGLASLAAALYDSVFCGILSVSQIGGNNDSTENRKLVVISANEWLIFENLGDTDPTVCIQSTFARVSIDLDCLQIGVWEKDMRILIIHLDQQRDMLKLLVVAIASIGVEITIKEPLPEHQNIALHE